MHDSGRNHTGTCQQGQTSNAESTNALSDLSWHRWGVILAGGDGTRLQPLTRLACGDNRPKQFCPLLGGKTLLAHTRQRISRSIAPDRTLFVLTRKHEPFFREELKDLPWMQKVVQPQNQGTLPAILWSLLRLFRTDQQALVAFFPSDHYFAHENEFVSTVERALNYVSKERDSVVLLGASAERPETEYGWIEPENKTEDLFARDFTPVRRFWEKPPHAIAQELLAKKCLWNTFVMVGSVAAFLAMVRRTSPALFGIFEPVLSHSEPGLEEEAMQLVYDALHPADFSREVLALSTERLLVASCGEVGWSDLGEPRRFVEALTENGAENPWAVADTCYRCGLTREQAVTLSSLGSTRPAIAEDTTLARTH